MKITGYSGFPLSPKKPTLPNSNSIWNARTRLNEFSGTPKCSVGTKQITIFLKNNHSKHRKVEITQKIQKEARDGQTGWTKIQVDCNIILFLLESLFAVTVFNVLFCCL